MSAIPARFDRVRLLASRAMMPLLPTNDMTRTPQKDFLFSARRSVGASNLPPPHLLYFLLHELLGYRDLGRWEKLAWSIPVDFEGEAFLIEHRKFGVGVFSQDGPHHHKQAQKIALLLGRGVRCAQPYFRWKAEEAVKASNINIVNNSADLYKRYEYFRGLYYAAVREAEQRKDERIVTPIGETGRSISFPSYEILRNANRLAIATIDAFFGWTEHAFIHIAILNGEVSTGEAFERIAGADWGAKFKNALDISDPSMKAHFDDLMLIRRQLRNFMAHGAFGKDGEAFSFHSSAGAVPVAFDYSGHKRRFSLSPELQFDDEAAIGTIDKFIAYLWSGEREAARIYIQDSYLPLIMTMANDGTYARAMRSVEDMRSLVEHLSHEHDNAANMDW